MLLALSSIQPVQFLSPVILHNTFFLIDMDTPISTLLKHFNAKNYYKHVVYLRFHPDDSSICPCIAFKDYIDCTCSRGDSSQLSISFQKTYHPASSIFISRWFKIVMEEAGLDTSYFKAHSFRLAGSSTIYSKTVRHAKR